VGPRAVLDVCEKSRPDRDFFYFILLLLIKYTEPYVGVSTSSSYRHTHCGIFRLRVNEFVLVICIVFVALHNLLFFYHLKQEHK
jgi:hypothetical protein